MFDASKAKKLMYPVVIVSMLGLLLVVTGCGSSGSSETAASSASETTASAGSETTASSDSTGESEGTAEEAQSRPFPELKISWAAIDHLDPALAYGGGFKVVYGVYATLVAYRHANGEAGTELVPMLAEAMPKISSDQRTYTFTLRKGLKYSDGKPIEPSDIANGIERDFKMNSPAVDFYSTIEGAEKFGEHPEQGNISGIKSDDKARTISFTLVKPRGDFLPAMALSFAAPVPKGTPDRDQSVTPIPASGQYKIVSYEPGQSFVLEKNKDYTPVPGVPAGNPERVTATIVPDVNQALEKTINDETDWDEAELPSERIGELQEKYPSQFSAYERANTEMFFMNERMKPFNDVRVRKAINYAIDRNAFVKFAGGLATTTQNMLPPSYPSYEKITYYKHDIAKAKQLVEEAGAVGDKVRVIGASDDPFSRAAVTYLANVLEELGMKPELKLLALSVYFDAEGDPNTNANIGWAQWNQDYPHPLDWFGVLVDGSAIQDRAGNTNPSFANIPALNAKIAKLEGEPELTKQVNEGWAEVDREAVVKYATYAPYVNLLGATFFGPKIDKGCEIQLSIYGLDWTALCMKE
jgi:peptide/nickel transport system substrate-binding protein